jgi:hypothetical protein
MVLEMSSKDRRVSNLDPDNIRKVIYAIDAYRNHVFYDISWIDKMVDNKTLGREFADMWKPLRRKMVKMASVTGRIPGLIRLARIQSYTEALWQFSVPILFIMLFVGLIAPGIPLIGVIAPYVMIFAFASVIIGILSRSLVGGRISQRINQYFENHPDVDDRRDPELHKAVQHLIGKLRQYVKQNEEDPEDHLVGIESLDYRNIKVVKEPRPWRKYSLVKVVI